MLKMHIIISYNSASMNCIYVLLFVLYLPGLLIVSPVSETYYQKDGILNYKYMIPVFGGYTLCFF